MKKKNLLWSVDDLQKRFDSIEFPEYQREPTVWGLDKKRKLIDSMLRSFDISSIYLYLRKDGNYDCIDGRQRINAILSFLGLNDPGDGEHGSSRYDNGFRFRSSDELLTSKDDLTAFDRKTYEELTPSQQGRILKYTFNVVQLTELGESDELNLMFLRLQLGTALNAGEKLNAMLGWMRNLIFGADGLGNHKYFDFLKIPKRRFARELTAAQIALNFFSIRTGKRFRRARFVDLQEFFSENLVENAAGLAAAALLRERLTEVHKSLKDSKLELRNRAIGVSTFFFINNLIEEAKINEIADFVSFLKMFLKRLKEQVELGIHIKPEYEEFLKFQTNISQAAVEKYAIENRQQFLSQYFEYFKEHRIIKGDKLPKES